VNQTRLIAGLVLGSNSFHMLTARHDGTQLKLEDHFQEAVQLAAGLNADGGLEADSLDRASACLERFGRKLRALQPGRAAAVATGVLRQAGNAGALLRAAGATLGIPVRVLSGLDEALLTYVGVALTFKVAEGSRLVIDIGGGSTELVVGRSHTVARRESVDLGCIPVTRRFFSAGRVSADAFAAAEDEVRQTMQAAAAGLRAAGWDEAVGTGGTIMGAGAIMQVRRMCGSRISRKGLDRLKAAMIEQRLEELGDGIVTPQRMTILPGGVAILSALFDTLRIDRMAMSPGALREGVLVMLARNELPGTAVVPDSTPPAASQAGESD
jgi:exopolyphosphatase / guanosine-5'-triphosphate,3'-diphosphate pyrophosphatase